MATFCQNIVDLYSSALGTNMTALPEDRMAVLMEKIKEKMKHFECNFSGTDAKKIHKALDSDGDKVVTESEWTSWILRGVSLSFYERKRFSGKSSLNMRMTNFLEAVCVICGGFDLLHGMVLTFKERKLMKLSKEAMRSGLKMLFDQFDTDASGCITSASLPSEKPWPHTRQPSLHCAAHTSLGTSDNTLHRNTHTDSTNQRNLANGDSTRISDLVCW